MQLTHVRALGAGTAALLALSSAQAVSVPNEAQMPGTQPGEVTIEPPNKCDNCHAGYNAAVEPHFNWQGSMMAHASRDPLYWAALAITEQDFPGAGDLCLRCHVSDGWLAGRSTPTDGSALLGSDAFGVACDLCHQLTDPDGSEHSGVQNPPFVANDGQSPASAYLGSGMYVLSPTIAKLGPYSDPASPHTSFQSLFHRSPELCGTCHDVSNPVVGDLAPGNGAMTPLPPGSYSGVLGGPLTEKAAFNNFPHQYGVVERTYSEHVASLFPTTPVSQYASLPADLQAGAVAEARAAAVAATGSGNYADGVVRTFTCQTCHMPPVQGKGCNKNNAPVRADLPLHDMTGGSTWIPEAIKYLDARGELPLGGGLTSSQITATDAAALRALDTLLDAAALEVSGDQLRVINLTGHKLITGYPEGRRMWLRVAWYDGVGALLREDGEYGWLTVTVDGAPTQVRTLLDLDDPHLRIYHSVPGVSQAWAASLVNDLGVSPALALEYDRVTGLVAHTLGELAASPPGTAFETFHFALNDTLLEDTRIPPWGMTYDTALERNILPVPSTQYGDPGPGGTYDYWDTVQLSPPPGAASASIELLFQSTSWEYIQFLKLANTGQSSFLEDAGEHLYEAWANTGMAEPVVLATAAWSSGCTGSATSYCTAGTTASGCNALISATGVPSASSATGFDVSVDTVEGAKDGILFFGTSGRQANSWGSGSSYQCVVPPVKRLGLMNGTGTQGACDGQFALDFNAWMAAKPLAAPAPGAVVQMQCWFRDPLNTSNQTTSLSDALEFTVCP